VRRGGGSLRRLLPSRELAGNHGEVADHRSLHGENVIFSNIFLEFFPNIWNKSKNDKNVGLTF
jgi:hypothetical protein